MGRRNGALHSGNERFLDQRTRLPRRNRDVSASLEKAIEERFAELGMPTEAFPDHSTIVRFFEQQYILLVRDTSPERLDVRLLAPDYFGDNNRKIWHD
jgi:hypothetical protein